MSFPKGLSEEPQPFQHEEPALASVPYTRLKIDAAGRLVIPAEMRAAMMVKPGETIIAEVKDGEFRIVSPTVALKRVQAFARKWKAENPGVSAVDELIAERRQEARSEDERYERLQHEGSEAGKASR
jgi:AbrB family looped-hinge helix DNA binding protein